MLRSRGKSTRSKQRQAWDRELKAEWAMKGIDRCEQCYGTFGLSLAHSKKRRFIENKADYWEVALLCQTCHTNIEYSGHENMANVVREIIANR